MGRQPRNPRIAKEVLLDVIVKFYGKNGYAPKSRDIIELHKSGLSPSLSNFNIKGGLTALVEEAGLIPHRKVPETPSLGDVRVRMLKWITDFEIKNGRIPNTADFSSEKPLGINAIKNHYGSFNNCLVVLGFRKVRPNKLANDTRFCFK